MCGRFTLTSSAEQIAVVLPELVWAEPVTPRYNIAPTQGISAVLNDGTGQVRTVRWGLIPSWARDPTVGNRMINARAESLAEKPAFRTALRQMRCLILADGFYEWQAVTGRKGKVPFLFRLKGGRPFAFAGLWDQWRDPAGETVLSATIITTEPNELVKTYHDRMPVILRPDRRAVWVEPREVVPEQLRECLGPFAAEEMEVHEVSTRVNNPGRDDPACVTPVGGDADRA